MAAAASPSLRVMGQRDALGRVSLESKPAQQPWLGRHQRVAAGRWALLSRGMLTPPLSQLSIASPLPTVLLCAALSAIKNKAHGGFLTYPGVRFWEGGWDSSSVVGQGFSGPILASHISTHTHVCVHTHTQSTCVGMIQLSSWDAGGTENSWVLPKKTEVKIQSCVTTATVALAGEGTC